MKKILLTLIFSLFIAPTTFSHPWKLDMYNWHTCYTNCSEYGLYYWQYHYHTILCNISITEWNENTEKLKKMLDEYNNIEKNVKAMNSGGFTTASNQTKMIEQRQQEWMNKNQTEYDFLVKRNACEVKTEAEIAKEERDKRIEASMEAQQNRLNAEALAALDAKIEAEIQEKQKQEEYQKQVELFEKAQLEKERQLKQATELAYKEIKKIFSKQSQIKQKTTLQALGFQLENMKSKFNGDQLVVIKHLIYLIGEEF